MCSHDTMTLSEAMGDPSGVTQGTVCSWADRAWPWAAEPTERTTWLWGDACGQHVLVGLELREVFLMYGILSSLSLLIFIFEHMLLPALDL